MKEQKTKPCKSPNLVKQNKVLTNEIKEVETYYEKKV